MSASTMTVSRPLGTDVGLDRVTLWLLLAFVASLQLSIAAAGILLSATFVCWVAGHLRDGVRVTAPRFFLPLALYAGATLVSSAFSLSPLDSFIDDKQLVLLAIVPMVYDIARGTRAATVVDVVVSVGAASAAIGIIQYSLFHYDNLGKRPEGALSLYMTYSGTLMLVICTAVARLLFGAKNRTWPALVMPALVVALSLTFTRNAWIGTAVAVSLLLVLKDFRLTALLPVAMAVMFVFAPTPIVDRMTSSFRAQDAASVDRVAMLEMGTRIVRDYPLTGVGPNMIPRIYERYRPAYAVNRTNPHLHNVPMQIAAERGLPALGIWFWFIVSLSLALWRLARRPEHRALAATALAAVVAMLAAGLFEYNFGDSEFLMLFLVLVTLPFAAARDAAAISPRDAAASGHA